MARVPLTEAAFLATDPATFASGYDVTVLKRGTETQADVYSAEEAGSKLVQPLVTDEGGRPRGSNDALGWVEEGSYDLLIDGQTIPWEAAKGGGGGGGAPKGAAGGDLAGEYPNPTIAEEAVSESRLKNLAVSAAKLAANAVTAAKIASEAVETAAIKALAVTTAKIAAAAVTAEKLAEEAVETAKIKALAVTEAKIAAEAVAEGKIKNLAVTAGKLASEAVEAGKIKAEAVTEGKIANLAVTAAKLGSEAVEATKIKTGAVSEGKLAAESVGEAKIKALAVTVGKLAEEAVETIKIKALAVTEAKLAAEAVATSKIKLLAVTAAVIAAEAVETAKIKAEAVTEGKIAAATRRFLSGKYNVEDAAYGAIPDSYFIDGKATSASKTFESATAAFVAGDVGKTIVIERAGPSAHQDHHTTIAVVESGTKVELANAAGRSQEKAKFRISRGGDSTTAIQAAINACAAAGGGTVYCPGVGYLVTGLVLKNRVWLEGAGMNATMLHLAKESNVPVIRNDYTENDSAAVCAVRNMWVDGNRARQVATTTTLGAKYVAGATTLTVASTTNLLPSGELLIGSCRFTYESIGSATELKGVKGGTEGTTDAEQANGSTVTQQKAVGIYFAPVPFNTEPTYGEYDPHQLIENVHVKNTKGDCISLWGQSANTVRNVWTQLTDNIGFRPSFDTWLTDCCSDNTGRMGYFMCWASMNVTNCKAFFAGVGTAADGYGFLVEGPATLEEGCKILSSAVSQDNKADGFYLRNAQRVVIQGIASSNGVSSAGTYVGVKLAGITSNCIIDVACTERVAEPNNAQRNALSIESTCTANSIRLSHGAAAGSVVGTAIKSGSDISGGNDIRINGLPIDTAGTKAVTTKQEFTATAFANITALTFPVLANGVYKFKAFIVFQTSVTTTAARIGVNGPTLTTLAALSRKQITAGGTASTDMFSEAILSAYDTALPASTDEIEATKDLIQEIEGTIVCSANGTVAIRMSKDVEAGTITVRPGSFLEFKRLDVGSI